MVSREELERLFCESTPPILELSEIRQWCRTKQLDDTNVQAHLQALIELDRIGYREISTGASNCAEITVYWLKTAQKTAVSTPASTLKSAPYQQRSVLRGGLKRTRQKFVSPLLAHKKPKLSTAQSEEERSMCTTIATSSNLNKTTSELRARLDFEDTQKDITSTEGSESVQQSEKLTLNSSESESSHSGDNTVQALETEKRDLEVKLKEGEEKLRKLKMVKMYRTKNNLQELATLTAKWREVAQEAAETLLARSTHQPRPSMAQMLDYLHIDHQLIQYSDQDESFY